MPFATDIFIKNSYLDKFIFILFLGDKNRYSTNILLLNGVKKE